VSFSMEFRVSVRTESTEDRTVPSNPLLLLSWEVKRERDRKCPCPPAPSLYQKQKVRYLIDICKFFNFF
jgi:hypothetical protein